MEKIKIAVIGTGHDHAVDIINVLKQKNDIYELVGFAMVSEDLQNCYEYTYEYRKANYESVKQMTVEELLNYPNLEAVCIETEDRALTKYAIMAAERGLHIQMDKPGGIDGDEFDRLIDIVKEKQLVFHMGYMYRYNSAILKLKEDIKSGKFGKINSIEAHMSLFHNKSKREWLANYPGGMLYFLGCHLIDFVYSIMGEPDEIIPMSYSSGIDGVTAEDCGEVILSYKNCKAFIKSSAVEQGGFNRRQLVVCGSNGTVEIKPTEKFVSGQKTFAAVNSTVREVINNKENIYDTVPRGRYDAMLCSFADYIRGEKKNPFDYEYERGLHKLILKSCGKINRKEK